MKAIDLLKMNYFNGLIIFTSNDIILIDNVYYTDSYYDYIIVFGFFCDPECSEWIDDKNFGDIHIHETIGLFDIKFVFI